MGVYLEGGLYVYDLNQELGSMNLQCFVVFGNDQECFVYMFEGDGKLFILIIFGYGILGGLFIVYDIVIGEIKVY